MGTGHGLVEGAACSLCHQWDSQPEPVHSTARAEPFPGFSQAFVQQTPILSFQLSPRHPYSNEVPRISPGASFPSGELQRHVFPLLWNDVAQICLSSGLGLPLQGRLPQHLVNTLCGTMRFGSTAKVLAKCMLKYYRISECVGACHLPKLCAGAQCSMRHIRYRQTSLSGHCL